MRRFLLLLAVALLAGPTVFAQSRPLDLVLEHLRAHQSALGLTADDLQNVVVTDEYTSRRSGTTHVYLRQTVNGVEVYNGRASAHVTRAGRVVGAHSTFAPQAAARASEPVPALSAEAAVEAAARHLGLALPEAPAVLEPADERHRLLLSDAGISLEPIPAQLVYFVTEEGALRLAWDLAIYQTDAQHYWSVRVDAHTGRVLDQADWVVQDEWIPEDFAPPADYRPLAPSPAAGAKAAGSYNVWALPLESPMHGERALALAAHDVTASPMGWHDTGSAQYTITRGNNVYAYEDRAGNNVTGYSPDGGESLAFDFPIDFEQQPVTYQDAAITNLFYWNNIIHDVLYQYGFDEVSGNFQVNNFGNGGAGNDPVRAEAQDGSGTNNANFATPPDGQQPRMQMFEWTAPPQFVVTAPEAIAGSYANQQASFGPAFPATITTREIVPVDDPFTGDEDGGAGRACALNDIFNTADLAGNIALIERGDCDFALKIRNVQAAGAVAAIIHNNSRTAQGEDGSPEDLVLMGLPDGDNGADISIPATFIRQSTGLLLMDHMPVEGYVLHVPINRDSDLDAGVIIHEYGHGVSNRLTGGPSTASCLNNAEQMGEGWSDFYALLLTMREEDAASRRRGVGTYLTFEGADGVGIRAFPYSPDLSVNPLTYENLPEQVLSTGAVSPHGVGTIWTTMLWEMTWNLIDQRGFDADVYNADGMAGNQIALNLVTEGLKLQPCSPGFVDGRDAILTADTLLYDGAHGLAIWTAFAKRGLGYSASQGSSNSIFDGTPAFDLPPGVIIGTEESALATTHRLTAAYPNPFRGAARLSLEVARDQDVRVALYDALGREVARLYEGPLAAGAARVLEVDGGGLAAGVYVVRATGETFTATQRLTLIR